MRGEHGPVGVHAGLPGDPARDCCAAKTRRLHDLSVEVLTSYELAEIARIGDGYDVGMTLRANAA